ncbi:MULTISPECIES: TRAP transporter large permease [Halomonas]|jgi:tripartite ATP-independent transporter DctM subunit|uniref:TRAP transporter large permease protein n=2 Tax=unclassified Halomonas TaxID=2609666 RepID=A0AAU7KGB0_9GAMM|nr:MULTISPECIES: TRAP transporter large permease [Halomonas]KJZ17217.1 C4-dicarboxylate ABC transporter permease [Halomonas sp. S2151]MBY6110122.1 TRAP transporter large permease [Halomonas sp. DP1Y21-3]MCJ8285697.1 TRAP transporter large permease [Halomonas sp.]MCO7214365.1 TRAP transporter large permease [Halomonas sp. OfavH-34-E]NQY70553.1 TRAP transporter large permease [Halomonas sp.]|tara:strand:- start:2141 stop:3427 length:1287 start_codon:yes stop_codon:yes gene_type:complete
MIIASMFFGLIGLILINVPVAIALGLVGALATVASYGTLALPNVGMVMFDGATKFPLIAIPLFILAGAIMNASSISRRLIDLASAMVGFIKGGLAMVTIGASIFFAEISGSAVAGVSAIGSILIPAMRKKGYSKEFAAAISSSAASLAIILPPSIPMILYAVMSGESVVKMFVAGIFPGLLGALGLAAMCYFLARRHNLPAEQSFQASRLWEAFKGAIWALLIPVIILGGIFGGIVTATEGAALAVVVAIFISAVIYREFSLKIFYKACLDAGVQTAVVMLLVASSAVVGLYLTETQIPQQLANSIAEMTDNKYVVLALLNVIFLVLGIFLHSAAAIILVVPIVLPLVTAVGIDPLHFGLIVTLNLAIGQQTPPVASVLIASCSIAKADIWATTRTNLWFLAVLFVILLINTYVPAVALALVNLIYGV